MLFVHFFGGKEIFRIFAGVSIELLFINGINMRTNESINRNDVLDLTKQGLSTLYNIAQMARYRYLYVLG